MRLLRHISLLVPVALMAGIALPRYSKAESQAAAESAAEGAFTAAITKDKASVTGPNPGESDADYFARIDTVGTKYLPQLDVTKIQNEDRAKLLKEAEWRATEGQAASKAAAMALAGDLYNLGGGPLNVITGGGSGSPSLLTGAAISQLIEMEIGGTGTPSTLQPTPIAEAFQQSAIANRGGWKLLKSGARDTNTPAPADYTAPDSADIKTGTLNDPTLSGSNGPGVTGTIAYKDEPLPVHRDLTNQERQVLESRGVDPDAFVSQLRNGELNTPQALAAALGDKNTYSVDEINKATEDAKAQYVDYLKSAHGGQDPETIAGGSQDKGSNSPGANPAAGYGSDKITADGRGIASDSTGRALSPSVLGNLQSRGLLLASKTSLGAKADNAKFPGDVGGKGPAVGTIANVSASLLASRAGAILFGRAATPPISPLKSVSKTQWETNPKTTFSFWLSLGIQNSRVHQNIFQVAHRHYRIFHRWKKTLGHRDRVAAN